MPTRWMVRDERGALSGRYGSEQAARSRGGQGRLVPGPDGRGVWSYDLPEGWTVEAIELPELSDEQVLAVAYLASQADNGCAHCVGRQHEVLATMWPEVDWGPLAGRSRGAAGRRTMDDRELDDARVPR